MKKSPLRLLVVLLLLAALAGAQSSRRQSNVELTTDLDADKTPDRIVKEKFEKPALTLGGEGGGCKTVAGHFIRYTLERNGQKAGAIIFEHKYGTAEADYWSYGLKAAGDLNGDGRKDLLYHAGDDASEEHVLLLQQADGFKAVYTGEMGHGEYRLSDSRREIMEGGMGAPETVVARWDAKGEVFAGPNVNWVTGDCVKVRAEPNTTSKVVGYKFQNQLVRTEGVLVAGEGQEKWQRVREGEGGGWINTRFLSPASPTKEFKQQ